jgi:hypothetical protein
VIVTRFSQFLLAFLAVAVCGSSAFAEQWVKVNDVNGNPLYVDTSRLSAQGDRARAWVKSSAAGGTTEIQWLFEFACTKSSYRTVESITRSQTGTERTKYKENDPFKAMGSTSGYAPAYKMACQPILDKAAPPSNAKSQADVPSSAGAIPAKEPAVPSRASGNPGNESAAPVVTKQARAEAQTEAKAESKSAVKPETKTTVKEKRKAWRRVAVESTTSRWYIDTNSVEVNGPFILGWLRVIDASGEPLFVLQEYDCDSFLQRAHALGQVKFEQPGGWTQSSGEVRNAFTPFCASSNPQSSSEGGARKRSKKMEAPQQDVAPPRAQ